MHVMKQLYDLSDEQPIDRKVIGSVIANGALKNDEREIFVEAKALFDANNTAFGRWIDRKTALVLEPSAALRRCVRDGFEHVSSPSRDRMRDRQVELLETIRDSCPKQGNGVVSRQQQKKSVSREHEQDAAKRILSEM